MSEETNKLLESIIAYQMVLKKQIVQYEERINKAIKYLKSKEWAIDYEKSSCRTHLLEILKGEDKE